MYELLLKIPLKLSRKVTDLDGDDKAYSSIPCDGYCILQSVAKTGGFSWRAEQTLTGTAKRLFLTSQAQSNFNRLREGLATQVSVLDMAKITVGMQTYMTHRKDPSVPSGLYPTTQMLFVMDKDIRRVLWSGSFTSNHTLMESLLQAYPTGDKRYGFHGSQLLLIFGSPVVQVRHRGSHVYPIDNNHAPAPTREDIEYLIHELAIHILQCIRHE
jgi:hypothetical protein